MRALESLAELRETVPGDPPEPGADEAALPAASPARTPPRGRRSALAIAALFLVAAAVPVGTWLHHEANFVVSRNALVRAQLSELGMRVEGVIQAIYVDAGDRVQAGDILLRLDDTHLQAELAQARARHAGLAAAVVAEQAGIDAARDSARLKIQEAAAAVRGATASLQAAQLRATDAAAFHEARRALLPREVVSREVVRDAQAQADTAQALLAAAAAEQESAINQYYQAQHALTEIAVRERGLAVLEAEREEHAARLSRVEADLEATVVRAPADGAIVRRLAQPGMAVAVGTPTLSMWFSDNTWVEAWVEESELSEIAVGTDAFISSPALPGESLTGVVRAVGLATDFEMPLDHLPQSRAERLQQSPLVGIAVKLESLPEILRPGMSAVVNIARNAP